ncbi:NmrA family NAD(P)-binding protein [Streptomyces sp. NPDC000410]|uniref:SDR family oxidoreductase n=1 Tax=Streptomyces sp. NPDC000410 TaxID=3154254 RepID=UPI00332F617A
MSGHSPMRVAVVGATGYQGGAVARLLTERGHQVRTLTRRPPEGRPDLTRLTYVPGDLADPHAVRDLLAGATHASVVMPLEYDPVRIRRYARNLAEAALAAGIVRLVHNANTRIPAEITGVAAFETRRLAESVLRKRLWNSPVELVVLRPPVYLDNLFSPWNGPALVRDGTLAYPLPADTPVAWLSHRDLPEAVCAALTVPDAAGRTYDIGGARTVTGAELAAAFGTGLGRDVRYVPLPADAFEHALARVVGADAAAGVAGIYHYMASGGASQDLLAGDGGISADALALRPEPVESWVSRMPWQVWADEVAAARD